MNGGVVQVIHGVTRNHGKSEARRRLPAMMSVENDACGAIDENGRIEIAGRADFFDESVESRGIEVLVREQERGRDELEFAEHGVVRYQRQGTARLRWVSFASSSSRSRL